VPLWGRGAVVGWVGDMPWQARRDMERENDAAHCKMVAILAEMQMATDIPASSCEKRMRTWHGKQAGW